MKLTNSDVCVCARLTFTITVRYLNFVETGALLTFKLPKVLFSVVNFS